MLHQTEEKKKKVYISRRVQTAKLLFHLSDNLCKKYSFWVVLESINHGDRFHSFDFCVNLLCIAATMDLQPHLLGHIQASQAAKVLEEAGHHRPSLPYIIWEFEGTLNCYEGSRSKANRTLPQYPPPCESFPETNNQPTW